MPDKQGWVSVDDKLPSEDGEYIIVNYGAVCIGSFDLCAVIDYCGDSHSGMKFMIPNSDSDYGGMFVAYGVTHWMQLPKPPKKQIGK